MQTQAGDPGAFAHFDLNRVASPAFVVDEAAIRRNLSVLKGVRDGAEARVLLALKAFSCFAVSDLVMKYLSGTAASGLYEARLGRTRFGGNVHTYAPGLKDADIDELLGYSDHLILNSLAQWSRYRSRIEEHGNVETGLRVNAMHSEVENPLYDPSAPWSRLGMMLLVPCPTRRSLFPQQGDPRRWHIGGYYLDSPCGHGCQTTPSAPDCRSVDIFVTGDW